MFNRIKIFACTALIAFGVGPLTTEVSARGRSFPIEVTGTITSVNQPSQMFTIQVDEPAEVLTLALGHDCRFFQRGASTGAGILKKGARVKVSYFSTIFSGKVAVEVDANPRPQIWSGVIEEIEPDRRTLAITDSNNSHLCVIHWAANARFINHGKIIWPTKVTLHTPVEVSYYAPAFAPRYAVKVEIKPVSTASPNE
jgi:hypothetical protein